MSNRLSKGVVVAGKFSQDLPGFPKMGPAFRITNPGTTAEVSSGFVFGSDDVLVSFMVNVTTVTATSGTLDLGLLSSDPDGFIDGLAVGTTGLKTTMYTVTTSGTAGSEFGIGASYLGVLLGRANVGTTAGVSGAIISTPYALNSTTVKTLSYSYNSALSFSAIVYPIYYTLNS